MLDSRVAPSTTPRYPRRHGTPSNSTPPSGLPVWMAQTENNDTSKWTVVKTAASFMLFILFVSGNSDQEESTL